MHNTGFIVEEEWKWLGATPEFCVIRWAAGKELSKDIFPSCVIKLIPVSLHNSTSKAAGLVLPNPAAAMNATSGRPATRRVKLPACTQKAAVPFETATDWFD